jgi:hypothetical protein
MENRNGRRMDVYKPVRSTTMKLVRVIILMMVLLIMAGCAAEPVQQSNGISMEDWCAEDADMPWSGCWKEIGQIDCGSGADFEAEDEIGELRLLPDNRYSITWHPFETYTDYIGRYTINPVEGTITFEHDDEAGIDGDGSFSFRENGDLELRDIWFGSFYDDSEAGPVQASCGYVFRQK